MRLASPSPWTSAGPRGSERVLDADGLVGVLGVGAWRRVRVRCVRSVLLRLCVWVGALCVAVPVPS